MDTLAEVKAGIAGLDVSDAVKTRALEHLKVWLTEPAFAEYTPQIRYLIEAGKWDVLLDSFYQVIPFGTGGRRGPVGIGPNRINAWTIQASAQGHCQYLRRQYGDEANRRGVVLTFDVRRYAQKGVYAEDRPNPVKDLDGWMLARAAAEVYAANGLKVYMFNTARSTPELSFAIRHLNAVSGDMFSASHNLPPDNGKKVYDEHGGQLIPPHDQDLVDEVTRNVSEIKRLDFEEACATGRIAFIGEEIDRAYHAAARSVSMSAARGLTIVYSPLHGTGLSTVYPVLQQLGFDVRLCPKTSNPSGAFENVTFNIPNPEVQESFNASLPFAREAGADVLISTDPDADRIGIMVNHHGEWSFLTGNEIGILLAQYALDKLRAAGRLHAGRTVVKTDVTTSLIDTMARENRIHCTGDLLVGFKYVAEEMNRLEREGRIADFIFGCEESHGYLTGAYARDKDAAGAAVWIAEFAAELKQRQRTLVDALNDIYAAYGYCHNHLTEIRLLGAKGMEQIAAIMEHFRQQRVAALGEFTVIEKIDRWQGEPQPHLSETDTSARNVVILVLANTAATTRLRITVRPSGTEPKIKMYYEAVGTPCGARGLEAARRALVEVRERLEKTFMIYCYRLIGVDFPERGFLLFWQLPLADKLRYFDIEEQIAGLKGTADRALRARQLAALLAFLGANPVQKVDRAFAARYGKGIQEYLGL
ncbi:MAG: phospho-sugar mutase [Desulfobacterales bacterium]|jgi:phosphoglucomutase/phosphomannomutase|nr:phospho-sugar mutase [Desulfobacterales bacterium]